MGGHGSKRKYKLPEYSTADSIGDFFKSAGKGVNVGLGELASFGGYKGDFFTSGVGFYDKRIKDKNSMSAKAGNIVGQASLYVTPGGFLQAGVRGAIKGGAMATARVAGKGSVALAKGVGKGAKAVGKGAVKGSKVVGKGAVKGVKAISKKAKVINRAKRIKKIRKGKGKFLTKKKMLMAGGAGALFSGNGSGAGASSGLGSLFNGAMGGAGGRGQDDIDEQQQAEQNQLISDALFGALSANEQRNKLVLGNAQKALPLGESAKEAGSCCSDDPQEKIKIHAFRDSVTASLEQIVETNKTLAGEAEEDNETVQNEKRFPFIGKMIDSIKDDYKKKKAMIKANAKAIATKAKMGIMAMLGTLGILKLSSWFIKMGGFAGIKNWIIETISEQWNSLMDGLKGWWNDNVISNIQGIFERLGVLISEVMPNVGAGVQEIAKSLNSARGELTTDENKKDLDENGKQVFKQNTSIKQGLVSGSKKGGARQYMGGADTKWLKEVTSDYGKRTLNGKGDDHNGVDVRAKIGTPLTALDGGIVTKAGFEARSGNLVSVYNERTGKRVIYMHLSKIDPAITNAYKNNTTIKTGTPIGLSGDTGTRVKGPHIHISVKEGKQGSKYTDPLTYIEQVTQYNKNQGGDTVAFENTQTVEGFNQTTNSTTNVNPAPIQNQKGFATKKDLQASIQTQDSINTNISDMAQDAGEIEMESIGASTHKYPDSLG